MIYRNKILRKLIEHKHLRYLAFEPAVDIGNGLTFLTFAVDLQKFGKKAEISTCFIAWDYFDLVKETPFTSPDDCITIVIGADVKYKGEYFRPPSFPYLILSFLLKDEAMEKLLGKEEFEKLKKIAIKYDKKRKEEYNKSKLEQTVVT